MNDRSEAFAPWSAEVFVSGFPNDMHEDEVRGLLQQLWGSPGHGDE